MQPIDCGALHAVSRPPPRATAADTARATSRRHTSTMIAVRQRNAACRLTASVWHRGALTCSRGGITSPAVSCVNESKSPARAGSDSARPSEMQSSTRRSRELRLIWPPAPPTTATTQAPQTLPLPTSSLHRCSPERKQVEAINQGVQSKVQTRASSRDICRLHLRATRVRGERSYAGGPPWRPHMARGRRPAFALILSGGGSFRRPTMEPAGALWTERPIASGADGSCFVNAQAIPGQENDRIGLTATASTGTIRAPVVAAFSGYWQRPQRCWVGARCGH